ncbi:MAG: hypothetical protein IJZ89_06535 [Clostridia bacterium]|nr:hypothetical protein [Clostridia bacterium]
MKSYRETTEKFAYSYMEYLIDLFDREGENATLGGFPCKIDENGLTLGGLLRSGVRLYLAEKNQKRAEQLETRLLRFFGMINEDSKTGPWGKQFILEALATLKNAGKLCIIPREKLELLEKKTDYGDFFNKEGLFIPKELGLPTNYYHVALACATYRELLGFENNGMSKKIADKLLEIMVNNSDDGWMDEVPPRGRFDSYSLDAYKTVYESLVMAGKAVPEFIIKNAKEAVFIHLSAKNRHGHGFKYGRSLSVYGEIGTLRQICFGFKHGFIEDKDEAIAYCIHICERLINFWYRKDENFFDIWTGSRSTDCYRSPEVIFNLNLGMCVAMTEVLEVFTALGIDTYIPLKDVSEPEKWEARKTVFVKEKGKERVLYVLRRGKHSFMLPFVGMSNKPNTVNDMYFAFPHEQEFTEAPVWRYQPFLVPEITMEDGTVAVLMEGFEEISESYGDDKITINVHGKLVGRDTAPTDIGFDGEYVLDGEKINVKFNIHKSYKSARMLFCGAKTDHVKFIESEKEEISDVSDEKDFRAACGGIKACKTAYFKDRIGYEIVL